MRIAKVANHLTRLSMVFLIVAGISTCGNEGPVLSVNRLAAQSNFGAEKPPLPPLEVRAPQFKQVFADVAEKVIPTVVSIRKAEIVDVREFNPFEWWFFGPRGEQQPRSGRPPRQQRREGIGSGVIVSKDGYVLTNNHVVEDAEDLTVTLSDKREFTAKIVGTDPPSELAVIKLEGAENLPVAHLGDSDKLRIGELVLAIGSPFGYSETVTMGIVSARGRSTSAVDRYENFIQTDAAINPGNSGGPLVDMNGSVIGINTAIISRTGGYQGIGFAIPINMAKEIMDILISEGYVSRGWLGVYIRDIEPTMANALGLEPYSGVLIDDIMEDTPAEEAGLKPGDVITEVNGEPVKNTVKLRDKVAKIKPGTKARFDILRDGKKMTFNIKLAEKESGVVMAGGSSEAAKEKTGLTLRNLNQEIRRQYDLDEQQKGVLIAEVDPVSVAARARLRVGMIILEADRKEVDSVREFNRIISESSKNTILLRVLSGGRTSFVPLRLEKE